MRPSLRASWPRLAATLTAAATTVVAIHWGTHTAGGADSYGYISQAYAWLGGGPPIAEPLAERIGVRDAAWVASPLGWRPGIQARELVPVYPPGLPWLMALFMAVVGSGGEFIVTPLFAAFAVTATYLLARPLSSRAVAALAAVLLASNPTFLYQAVQPMSDVPVTGLWAACLVAAAGASVWRWSAAGLLAGVAILVRPNLAPLAAGAVVWGIAWSERRSSGWRHHLPHVAAFGLPVVVAIATIAWTQARWYGSATLSGYGPASYLFSVARIPGNAARYARWLLETNPITVPLVAASVIGGAWRWWPSPRRASLALLLVVAVVLALYLPYITFDAWWFTRFLLPAFPPGFALSAIALAHFARRWRVPGALAVLLSLGIAGTGIAIAIHRDAFLLRNHESRYRDAGHVVRTLLPDNAIVLAMQHSGTVRLYGGRPTLRWDALGPEDLDTLVGTRLPRLGLRAYAVLDPDEYARFLERFAATATVREGYVGRMFVTKGGVEILKIGP